MVAVEETKTVEFVLRKKSFILHCVSRHVCDEYGIKLLKKRRTIFC